MDATRSIAVAGAGSIGCFVGGMLADAGRKVSLLARPRLIAEIAANGLRLTSFEGLDRHLPPAQLTLSDDPEIFAATDTILVTVKSADTAVMADLIAAHAPQNAIVVSLQNGIGNVDTLRQRLGGRRVLAAMVPFNVVALGDGRFHRATSGDIVIERDETDMAARLSVAGLGWHASDNIASVQWGKLLVNLNNALNALSGLPLREQIGQRPWRLLMADQIAEALKVMRAEGIAPVAASPLPPALLPPLLRLPNFLFQALLGRLMKIDPKARSSMWEDLQRGRRTEVDYLQGVIVDIGARHGLNTPLSRRIVGLIRAAEASGKGAPGLAPEQVRGDAEG